jgi:integrase/recombinase XerC
MDGETLTGKFLIFLKTEKRYAATTLKDYKTCLNTLGERLCLKTYREFADAIVRLSNERKWTDRTRYKHLTSSSEYFAFCVREGYIKPEDNPLKNGHQFKKTVVHRIEFFDWNDPAFKKLFNNPHVTIRIKCLLHVLKSSGIRANELCHLKIKNVQGRWLEIENGKGGVSRTAPIDEETRYWLGHYMDCLKEHYSGEWLFPREDYSGPMTTSNLGKILKRMGEKIGMNIYPHKFRHSLAGHLINNGCDLAVAAQVLGHKDVRTTQIYTHFTKPQILTKYDDALKSL